MSVNEKLSNSSDDILVRNVPLKKKLTYAVGLFGTQIYNGIQASSTAWFWLNIMGIDNIAYSIVMLVFYNIWNALNDPIFGWLSDNTRTRWGRRIPYMRLFSPIWFVASIFLFLPLVQAELALIIWFTVFILIFDGCYTFVAGCYNSLLGEISFDTQTRTNINTLAWVFATVGIAIAYIGPLLFKENIRAFQIFVVVGSSLGLLALLIPSFLIKERPIPPEETPLALGTALKGCIKNKPFMAFVGWNFCVQFTTAILIANIVFYATFVLSVEGFQATFLVAIFLICALPGFIILPKLQKKWDLRKAVMFATIVMAFALVTLIFIQEYWQIIIALGLAGFGASVTMIYPNVMMTESADYDELTTNRRREAIFFGTNALFTKPAIGLAQAILALTLLFTGFVSDTVNPRTGEVIHNIQPATAILGIRLIMGLFTFIALVIALIPLFFYPSGEEVGKMKKQIEEIRVRKGDTISAK